MWILSFAAEQGLLPLTNVKFSQSVKFMFSKYFWRALIYLNIIYPWNCEQTLANFVDCFEN